MPSLISGRKKSVGGWILLNYNINSFSINDVHPEKSLDIVSNPNLSNAISPTCE